MMMKPLKHLVLFPAIFTLGLFHLARGQHHGHQPGKVNLKTSCHPTANQHFTTGLALLRPMMYEQAEAVFSIVPFSQGSQSQTPYSIMAGSQVTVSGTSTLHQWSMRANEFTGEGNFVLTGGELKDVTAFQFMLPVTNLKSKEKQMQTKAYKALKANEYDKITFKLTGASILPQQKVIRARGGLTIAGITNQVELQTDYVVHADHSITCNATQTLKMSDYHIQPPKFMMGKVKTGDEVTVNILLQLKP